MKKNFYAAMLGAGLLLTGCQNQPSARHLWVADVREAIRTETPVSLKEDVASVSYVPLETADSCLISNVSNLVMDDEFIFVENGKTQQIFQLPVREVCTPAGQSRKRAGGICSICH